MGLIFSDETVGQFQSNFGEYLVWLFNCPTQPRPQDNLQVVVSTHCDRGEYNRVNVFRAKKILYRVLGNGLEKLSAQIFFKKFSQKFLYHFWQKCIVFSKNGLENRDHTVLVPQNDRYVIMLRCAYLTVACYIDNLKVRNEVHIKLPTRQQHSKLMHSKVFFRMDFKLKSNCCEGVVT